MGHLLNRETPIRFASAEPVGECIVIDAGHGGEDGGCVSDSGVLEKDVNLEVARKISEILKTSGYNVVLTRDEDKMLYDLYGDDYEGKKKTYDLKNRLKLAMENDAGMLVSIHMNKFPKSQYKGLQVYYSKNAAESRELAQSIQSYCCQYLQKDNKREIKAAGSNIYLLSRAEMPAVLVECGFLSNPEEAEQLCDDGYRQELGFIISAAIMSSLES